MLALLNTSTKHNVFSDCDVVIEAVTENEEIKTAMYRELAGVFEARRDPGEQHLDDLDHPHGRGRT